MLFRSWINGSPCTATQMRALGEQLLDIHGQHAWQSLTRSDAVRDLLDNYALIDRAGMSLAWRAWRDAKDELDRAEKSQGDVEREKDRLQWQIQELDKLAPRTDEWPELNLEHQRLSHAQALIDAAQAALDQLDEGDRPATLQLNAALDTLGRQSDIEPEFQNLCDILSSAQSQVDDASRTLRGYLRRTDPNPERLVALDERLGRWLSLAKQYHLQPEDLASTLIKWHEELGSLETRQNISLLQAKVSSAEAQYLKLAQNISAERHRAGQTLEQAITHAMQGLGMAGGAFQVEIAKSSSPLHSGMDDVTFMIAGHAGSTPRPISRIASGGELSRLALAIAVTTSRNGTAATLIFDEVDAGVRPAPAVLVEVARACDAGRQLAERAAVVLPEAAHGVAILAVPLRPQHRELSDLVAAGANVPGFGDEFESSQYRVLL